MPSPGHKELKDLPFETIVSPLETKIKIKNENDISLDSFKAQEAHIIHVPRLSIRWRLCAWLQYSHCWYNGDASLALNHCIRMQLVPMLLMAKHQYSTHCGLVNDAIWHYRSLSTSVQVIMVCCQFSIKAFPETNVDLSSVGPSGTNFSEIFIKIQTASFNEMHLKMFSVK